MMQALDRFTFGGQAGNDQRVYYINAKEIMNNKIGIGNLPFRDSEFHFTIKLRGFGTYSYKITNPVLFFQNVCGASAEVFRKEEIDQQLRAELQAAMQPAIGRVALKGIAYDQLPLYVKEIANELNEEMSGEWRDKRGIEICTFALSSIQPDEESAKKIGQFQESRVYTDPGMLGARMGTAQANAMETAAGNSAGAINGFMGMNFAAQAGGNAAADLLSMGQQKQAQSAQQSAVQPARQAASKDWFCPECGQKCSGNFCPACGTKRPASVTAVYQCSKCGWKPEDPTKPPKFCPNCGDRFDDADLV
jgi:membrane protease subunit (stomatin/prohibitin family)